MKSVLIDLFTSKKFLAALAAIIIYLGGRFGFAIDPAVLDRVFAALLVYVGAQGVADAGKSAAAINAVASTTNAAISAVTNDLNGPALPAYGVGDAMKRVAATVIMLTLGGFALSTTACTSSQRTAVAHVIWDCTSPERAEAVAALTPLSDSAIALATNPDGTLDTARLKASFTGANLLTEAGVLIACAAVGSLAVLRTPPAGPITQALSSGPTTPRANPQAADRALAELRAPWGTARFRVQAGEL